MAKTLQSEKYARFWTADGLHHASPLRIWGFTMNNVATNMYFFLMAYSSYYLVGFVGMAVVLASSFATIMRLWDGITDPIIGYLIDRTNGRFGKNRPYMVLGNIGLHITSFILFHVTHQLPEGIIRTIFFFAVSAIYYVFFTFQNAITRAGQACLTNDPKQRPLFSMFDGLNLLVMQTVLNLVLSSILVPKYGTMYSAELFHDLWVLCLCVSVVGTCIAVFAISPKDRTEFFGTGKPQLIRFRDYLDVIKHNRAIQMLIVAACTDKVASQSRVSAIGVVLYGVLAGNYALSGGLSVYTNIASAVFCIVGAGFIATRFGQKRALVLGSIGALVANALLACLWLFGNPKTLSLPGYEGFAGFTFFTIALLILNIFSTGFTSVSGNIVLPMIADCADYEVYRSGKYVPGLMGTLFSLVDKCVSSIAPMITGLMFAAIGFTQALPDINTPETPALRYMAVFVMFGMTIIGLLFNLVAMKFYPLSKEKMIEIQETIQQIKAKAMQEND